LILPADQAYLRTRLTILFNQLRSPEAVTRLIALPADELLDSFHIDFGPGASKNHLIQQFEQDMLQIWLNEMSALLRPLKGPARAILIQWARRYELFNLKALIRGKVAGLSRTDISASLFHLPGFLSLDHEGLLHTDDITELLRRLDGTPYQSIARQAHRRFVEKQDHYLLDAALDQFFYAEMYRLTDPLDTADRQEMQELLGRVIDRHNLVWMLRYRYNYALSPAEAHYLSIDHGYRLNSDLLARLVEQTHIEDFLRMLPGRLQQITGETADIVLIESRLVANLKHHAYRFFRRSPSLVTMALAYLILRYLELKALYALVQARILGLSDQILLEALDPALRKVA
jgi:V/A-type H+-transporting ATPase subunit C